MLRLLLICHLVVCLLDDMQNWQSSASVPRVGEFDVAVSLFLLIRFRLISLT